MGAAGSFHFALSVPGSGATCVPVDTAGLPAVGGLADAPAARRAHYADAPPLRRSPGQRPPAPLHACQCFGHKSGLAAKLLADAQRRWYVAACAFAHGIGFSGFLCPEELEDSA